MMRPPSPLDKESAEDEALTRRLNRETKFTRLQQNLNATSEIIKIQAEANSYLHKIEAERARVSDLDAEIANFQAVIVEQRRKMGGANAAKENNDMITRQVRHLEGRLDKSLVRFNESLARNKTLREKIDSLRRERVVFDGVYKKIENELHEKKKEMAAIIEDSKNAYQARDKAASELSSLKAQAEHDQTEFEREWEKLGKAMEENLRLRETLGRVAPGAGGLAHGNIAHGSRGGRPLSSAGGVQSYSAPLSPSGGSRTHSLRGGAQLEGALERIRTASGLPETSSPNGVYDITDKFLATEDKNFRLFNFVNGLNTEVERLEMILVTTKGEIEQFKGQGLSADAERKKTLSVLTEKLERTKARTAEYEAETKNTLSEIAALKTGIQAVFTRLGPSSNRDSDNKPSDAETLGSQGVTETNMSQYLAVIEQRASEIFQQHCESQQPGSAAGMGELMANLTRDPQLDDGEVSQVEEGALSPGGVLCIKPPAMDDLSDHGDDSDNEDDERPLTRGEAHKRTFKGIVGANARSQKSKDRR